MADDDEQLMQYYRLQSPVSPLTRELQDSQHVTGSFSARVDGPPRLRRYAGGAREDRLVWELELLEVRLDDP